MEAMFPRFHLTSCNNSTTLLQALIHPHCTGASGRPTSYTFDLRLRSGVHRVLPDASHPTAHAEVHPLTDNRNQLLVSLIATKLIVCMISIYVKHPGKFDLQSEQPF